MSEVKTTESSILDNIPDLDMGGSVDDTTSSDASTSTTSTDESKSSNSDTVFQQPAANPPATTGSEGNTQQQTVAAPAAIQRRDGLIEVPSKDNLNTRDLVDPATGQVVAAGGRERATWERAQKLHHEARTAQQQRGEFERRAIAAEAKVGQQTEIQQLAQQHSVDHTGQKIAIQVYGDFLKDPVGVLTKMVAEVKSKGYTIPFLTEGVTPGMDAQALSLMLDQRLAPMMQERSAQAEQQRMQKDAKETLDNFLAVESDAVHNIGIIGEMLTNDKSLTLQTAWTKLMRMAYQAGMDPTQPLGPQYNAKLQQSQQQTTQTQQQPTSTVRNTQQPLPLPNGRQIANSVPLAAAKNFDENSRIEDIIRHSMRESGYIQ